VTTVLVAEDDEDILLLVATRLKRDGFDVLTARTGEEALELVRERRPELAVLDIGMPPPDGLEVVRRIREDPALNATRLLLLTAKALTLLLSLSLLASGITKIILAFSMKVGSSWLVFLSGLITAIVGAVILAHWPVESLYVLGIFLGVDLVVTGAGWIAIGLGLKSRV